MIQNKLENLLNAKKDLKDLNYGLLDELCKEGLFLKYIPSLINFPTKPSEDIDLFLQHNLHNEVFYEKTLPQKSAHTKLKKKLSSPFGPVDKKCSTFSGFASSGVPPAVLEGEHLPELLKQIEYQSDPQKFKEAILRCIQLYFDGLVEDKSEVRNPEVWAEQLEALNAMLIGTRITVAAFYRQNQEVPFDEVREVIMPSASLLIRHGSQKASKYRHLTGNEAQVGTCAANVADVLTLTGEEVDLIIPIASGGFEPAVLTADYLRVNKIFPLRYSKLSRNDSGVLIPAQAPPGYPEQQISGHRVLLVDDIVASGRTASKIASWVKNYNPTKTYFSVSVVRTDKQSERELIGSGLHPHQKSQHIYRYERDAV